MSILNIQATYNIFILKKKKNTKHKNICIIMMENWWIVVLQLLSSVWPFATPWTVACQVPLSFTISQSLLKFMSLSQWCYLTISYFAAPFSFCLQSFPLLESFPMSQLFTSDGQVLELQLWHESFQWIFNIDFL